MLALSLVPDPLHAAQALAQRFERSLRQVMRRVDRASMDMCKPGAPANKVLQGRDRHACARRSPESLRDVRGFSVKFYTEEGNWDFVGNDIPVRAAGMLRC